jgi:hypothetical protein
MIGGSLVSKARGALHALQEPNEAYVLSYRALRVLIGVIGILLPFVLLLGKRALDGPGIQGTISDYYYTSLRDYFVGSLCAIGVFLTSYRGPQRIDQACGLVAAACAIGVALFPTTPESASSWERMVGMLHLACAVSLFLAFAFFSLVLFRRTAANAAPAGRKLRRNRVYAACGWTILGCIALALAVHLFAPPPLRALDPVFWLESVAIVAFAFSWLTKGEVVPYLRDRRDDGRPPRDGSEAVVKQDAAMIRAS